MPCQVHKSRSWYGSWPRVPKASASSPQLAREYILGGNSKPSTDSTPELRRFDLRKHASDAQSTETTDTLPPLPNIPETSQVLEGLPENNTDPSVTKSGADDTFATLHESCAPPLADPKVDQKPEATVSSPERPATSSGWLHWMIARKWETDLGQGETTEAASTQTGSAGGDSTNAHGHPQEGSGQANPTATKAQGTAGAAQAVVANQVSTSAVPPSSATGPEQSTGPAPQQPASPKAEAHASSWFSFWGSTPQAEPPQVTEESTPSPSVPKMPSDKEPEDTPMHDAPPAVPEAPVTSPPPSVGSTWAFWSRDVHPKPAGKPSEETQTGPGELAVIGQGSEAHPEHAQGLDMASPENAAQGNAQPSKAVPKEPKTKLGLAATIRGKKSKRLRPQSMDLDESPITSGTSTPQPVASSKASVAESVPDSPTKTTTPTKQATTPETPTKAAPPNLLLPSFGSTYRMKDNPTIIQQITKLLLRTRQAPANHVFRVKETPKIKKAIAIGVHGLFPASYLRPLIGQPTGTSLRFASLCAESIRRWADAHGCPDCEIEKVALEGEGKIASRVDNLWKLLLNWIEQLRNADLIILACHSQGVPVAVMLLAKLIDLGIITNARIGVCAMGKISSPVVSGVRVLTTPSWRVSRTVP